MKLLNSPEPKAPCVATLVEILNKYTLVEIVYSYTLVEIVYSYTLVEILYSYTLVEVLYSCTCEYSVLLQYIIKNVKNMPCYSVKIYNYSCKN